MASVVSIPISEPRRRGRPAKYRDASQKLAGARERQQRQRDRDKDAGFVTIHVRVPSDVLGSLAVTAAMTLSDPKALAAFLVKGSLGPFRREVETMMSRAGAVWNKAKPFLRYAAFLEKPGSSFRVHGRILTHEDWRPVTEELAAIKIALARWGWTPARIDRFIRRAGERASVP